MPNGLCHLCGIYGPPTFEHVPPSAAFNDHRVLEADIHKLMGFDLLADLKNPTGKYNQRGSRKFTLCRRAITTPADGMVAPMWNFVHGIFPLCQTVQPHQFVELRFAIKPLNVLKQMLVMFCGASPPSFAQKHPSLVRYLLN